jgi:hypothetical protein
VNNTIGTKPISEPKSSSKSQEARLQREKVAIQQGKEALASALAKTLVIRRYMGNCKCGMMLMEQDKNPNAATYHCPRCRKSSPLVVA